MIDEHAPNMTPYFRLPDREAKRTNVLDLKKGDFIQMDAFWNEIYHQPEHNKDQTVTLYIRSYVGSERQIRVLETTQFMTVDGGPEVIPVVAPRRAGNTDIPDWPIGKAVIDSRDKNLMHITFSPDSDFIRFLEQGIVKQIYISAVIQERKQ